MYVSLFLSLHPSSTVPLHQVSSEGAGVMSLVFHSFMNVSSSVFTFVKKKSG
jgi:hypothetical protein